MDKVTIIRQSHQAELGPSGDVRRMVRTDFQLGSGEVFNVSVLDQEGWGAMTNEKIQALLKERATLKSLLGQ